MTGRRGSAATTPARPTRRQSVSRATPADADGRASAPPPSVARTPGARPPPARAMSATPRAPPSAARPPSAGAAAPRGSVGGIRRDLRAAVGGTPLRPGPQAPASASRLARAGPRASRLSMDTTLGDIFPAPADPEADVSRQTQDGGPPRPGRTPHRTPAARTPGAALTPLTRSAIRRASESRRPLARRSTLGAGVARVESPFDLLWRLAHPRPVPDMSLLETTAEQPGLETEMDTTAGNTLAPAGEDMLHPGPPVPGDLTNAAVPRLSSSQRSQRADGGVGAAQDEDEDWAAELDNLNLPSATQARAALDRVLASTPRRAAGQADDEEAERERDRLAEEELTRLLAVDPNDFTTMSAALARQLSTHARLRPDVSRTSSRRTPTFRAELGSDDSPGGAVTPARSEVTADETEMARRAAPPRTSVGGSIAGQPDEADFYGLGDEMPPLEDAPFFEGGEEPSFPYARDEASLTRDQSGAAPVSGSGEVTTGEADATAASATRMLNLSGAEAELLDEDQPGSPEGVQQLELEPVPEAGPEEEDVPDAEAGAESDGSWASDESVGGVLRQRLARRRPASGRSARRDRDQVPATLVRRLFTAVAGSNYRLDADALAAVQDASDAFFGALARDVSAAASARLRRPRDQVTTRAATITETDLLAALVAHGHVDARHDVYTTALTLLPRELSDWIDVARVEPQRAVVRRATQAARATNQAATQAQTAPQERTDEADEMAPVQAPGVGGRARSRPLPKPSQARSKSAKKRPAPAPARQAGASKRPRGVPANPLAGPSRPRAKAGRR